MMTNADKLRSMTDEELAEWMEQQDKDALAFCGVQLSEEVNQHNKETFLAWLKKEVDDDNKQA